MPVPINSPVRAREDWRKVRRLSRWSNLRSLRRVVLLLWFALFALDAAVAVRLTSGRVIYALSSTLLLFAGALWAFRRMATGLAQPTLEDRALLEYGEDFDGLKEKQRTQVFEEQMRDSLLGRARRDERDAELRLEAEGRAYRILRPGLTLAVMVYWVVCLLGPFSTFRVPLALTAIAFTWLALIVLILPTVLRMWREPDQLGETQLVVNDSDDNDSNLRRIS